MMLDIDRYKATPYCPNCYSHSLWTSRQIDDELDGIHRVTGCNDCGAEWEEIYVIESVTVMLKGKEQS